LRFSLSGPLYYHCKCKDLDANAVAIDKVVTLFESDVARWDQLLVTGYDPSRLAALPI